MPLYIKDPEVDRITERLAAIRRTSKTEVVRQALTHELERFEAAPSLVERGLAFVKALRERSGPANGLAADRAFIDDLYGEP